MKKLKKKRENSLHKKIESKSKRILLNLWEENSIKLSENHILSIAFQRQKQNSKSGKTWKKRMKKICVEFTSMLWADLFFFRPKKQRPQCIRKKVTLQSPWKRKQERTSHPTRLPNISIKVPWKRSMLKIMMKQRRRDPPTKNILNPKTNPHRTTWTKAFDIVFCEMIWTKINKTWVGPGC